MNAHNPSIYWSRDDHEGPWHIERDARLPDDSALCGYAPKPSWTRMAQLPSGECCAVCLRLYADRDIRPRMGVGVVDERGQPAS